jgi:membrane associated rhomboid family serine protease
MASVSSVPPDTPTQAVDEAAQTYCYRHSDTPTKLRCSRCDRPICGRCATPASVGQHCPECVADARRSAPRVKTAMQASAPVVLGIIITCAIVYLLQLTESSVTDRYGMSPIAVAYFDEWWRLLTATFLHSDRTFIHILFNMYVLYAYGPMVEQAFGHVRFATLYMVAGLAGSAASYTFSAVNILGVGASGAIFGIVGVLVVHFYNRGHRQIVNSLLGFIGINLVLGFVLPGIDNAAHIGGLVGGFALGYGFDNGGRPASATRQLLTLALVTGAAVALVIYRTATFPCIPQLVNC